MVNTPLLDRLVGIARSAGAVIMQHYREASAVQFKADRSPVTAADTAAHALIAAELTPLLGGLPVVSEEGWIPGAAEQTGLRTFWLVDPLDGTKEFIARNGEFTVNIALIDQDRPIAGVVFAPAIDSLYFAADGRGAWRIGPDQEPRRLSSTPPEPGQPLVVVESRSHPSAELEAWIAGRQVARRINAGSSLKFCRVAEGAADVYPRFGTTMEWDVAAGDCVFRWSGAAGPRFSPLRYNKPGFRNGPFVIGLEEAQVHVP
jgi:3'(2'), 5'-bisphosphate nucleotidase